MKHRYIITAIVLLITTTATAQARTGSWHAVERLRPGTHIFVKADRHVRCVFVRATNKELVCHPVQPLPVWIGKLVYHFDRRIVLEVRLEHSDAFNGMVGTAIGAGAGAALGAALNGKGGGLTRGGGALFGALLCGVIGGVIGRTAPLFHGKVIYRR